MWALYSGQGFLTFIDPWNWKVFLWRRSSRVPASAHLMLVVFPSCPDSGQAKTNLKMLPVFSEVWNHPLPSHSILIRWTLRESIPSDLCPSIIQTIRKEFLVPNPILAFCLCHLRGYMPAMSKWFRLLGRRPDINLCRISRMSSESHWEILTNNLFPLEKNSLGLFTCQHCTPV